MEKCLTCGRYSVVFEEYYGRNICLMSDCGWSESTSEDRQLKRKSIECLEEETDPFIITNESGIGIIITDPKKFGF